MAFLCATAARGERLGRLQRGLARLALLLACSCHAEPVSDPEPPPARSPDPEELERARSVRLFFAHQSVGQNILNGIAELSAHRIEPTSLLALHPNEPLPGWVDMPVGQNGDPEGKIDAFVAAFEKHPTFRPELALLKFCFVDFQPTTDVDQLFHRYERALHELEARHPETIFGHVTVPLTVYPTDLKWRAFRLVGRRVWEDEANIKRSEFNRRLLSVFASDPIFDLSGVESLGPDGHRSLFQHDGQRYAALEPRYAEDEGHLNALGQQVVGTAFLRFVARARR
jgi:hypothetical protein